MLDINLIRNEPEMVRENLKRRNNKENLKLLDELIEKDKKWRELKTKNQELQHKRNVLSKKIGQLKSSGKSATKEMKEVAEIPEKIKANNRKTEKLREACDSLLLRIPNLIHESVPDGKGEEDNTVIREFGSLKKDFKMKDHLELGEKIGVIDRERAAKISGNGFYYLKNDLVLLDFALLRFSMDHMLKKGYTLIETPFMMNRKPLEGVVNVEEFKDTIYKVEGEDLYLIGTAEAPLAAMYMNEVLKENDLPLKLVGFSTNFRKEIGSHGKYGRGLFRMHQFNKLEQMIICRPENSYEYLEELQKNAEEIYEKMGLAFRVVNTCSGELGDKQAKMYDIEVLMGDGKYREIGSNSNCTDYQARRLNIKYREKEGKPAKGFVHILNNTVLATSRTMIAILEQYQQKDGSVKIPEALVPYMNGKKLIKS